VERMILARRARRTGALHVRATPGTRDAGDASHRKNERPIMYHDCTHVQTCVSMVCVREVRNDERVSESGAPSAVQIVRTSRAAWGDALGTITEAASAERCLIVRRRVWWLRHARTSRADPQSADAESVVLGQFGCPVARTDFVTRVGVSDPEAKPARAIASDGGDVVVSEHLVRRHDGRDAVWIVEAQRGHVENSMTRRAAAGCPAS
jgi:hypothetical protein